MRDFHTPTATQGRYVGPDAWQIAGRLPHRVRFERGWFHTAAVCHGSLDDRLSLRQRPDGGAIDVRCHSAGCSRQRVIKRLEALTGESIWSAYEQGDTVLPANEPHAPDQRRLSWRDTRLLVVGAVFAMLIAPFAFGYGVEVAALNAFGLDRASVRFTRRTRAVSPSTPTRSAGTASVVVSAVTSWISFSGSMASICPRRFVGCRVAATGTRPLPLLNLLRRHRQRLFATRNC